MDIKEYKIGNSTIGWIVYQRVNRWFYWLDTMQAQELMYSPSIYDSGLLQHYRTKKEAVDKLITDAKVTLARLKLSENIIKEY